VHPDEGTEAKLYPGVQEGNPINLLFPPVTDLRTVLYFSFLIKSLYSMSDFVINTGVPTYTLPLWVIAHPEGV